MPETFNRISKTYAKNEIEDTKKIENDILEGLKNKTSKRSLDNLINDYRIVKKINSKEHRENERNEIAILRINENTTVEEFKDRIVHFQNVLESAYNKIYSITNMPVYIKKSDAPNEFILGFLLSASVNNRVAHIWYSRLLFTQSVMVPDEICNHFSPTRSV